MSGYTKLFHSIVTSSIWSEDDKTRICWITLLAIADKNGEVQAAIPGLARLAGVSIEDAQTAIEKFLSPDPHSRTPDDEGRRIEPIDGGWAILNHGKYREMASREELREADAKRKARYRAKTARNKMSQNVPDMSHDVPKNLHIAEAEADTYPFKEAKASSAPTPAIAWSAEGGWQGISQKVMESWSIAYPACDLTRQLAAMNEWLLGNSTKAKKKQWRRFITNWLERAQERGGDGLTASTQQPSAKPSWLPANWRQIASEHLGGDFSEIEYHDLTFDEKHTLRSASRHAEATA